MRGAGDLAQASGRAKIRAFADWAQARRQSD
jgi:hypothetical protein